MAGWDLSGTLPLSLLGPGTQAALSNLTVHSHEVGRGLSGSHSRPGEDQADSIRSQALCVHHEATGLQGRKGSSCFESSLSKVTQPAGRPLQQFHGA